MDAHEFRELGKRLVDYIADYHETIATRNVLPNVEPGYIRDLISPEAPKEGENLSKNLIGDFEKIVMPGLTHWQAPNFLAYYPASFSFSAVLGDLMSSGLGMVGINWITGPAITELEVVMMDWMGKMLDLPEEFLNCSEGPGGGVIKGTASEATLVCLLAAKERTVRKVSKLRPELTKEQIKSRLRSYSSDQSNSSIEKSGLLASTHFHLLPSNDDGQLCPKLLKAAMQEDLRNGLFPCYVVATLGTTGTCAFDDLAQIGPVCEDADVWLHVDAAYAGICFVLPEYRHLKNGLEYARSFNFNPHKSMLVNFDCSALWVKDSQLLMNAFTVERPYLQHNYEDTAPEYLHWQIPLGRRFRALKIWLVLKSHGVSGIQEYLKKTIGFATYFSSLVSKNAKFEVTSQKLGLVCFRIKSDDSLNKKLVDRLSEKRRIFLLAYEYKGKTVIRASMNSNYLTEDGLRETWLEIEREAEELMQKTVFVPKETLFEFDVGRNKIEVEL